MADLAKVIHDIDGQRAAGFESWLIKLISILGPNADDPDELRDVARPFYNQGWTPGKTAQWMMS